MGFFILLHQRKIKKITMQKLQLRITQILFISLFITAMSCTETDEPTPNADVSINLVSKGSLGEVLSDAEGMSLYFFTKDVSGESACTNGCLTAWPVFYMQDIAVGTGLNASEFGNITRADGTKQTTYKGWPLYYFASDAADSDVNGDGVGSVWFAAKTNYSLFIGQQEVADTATNYLIDADGNTLYYFANDEQDISNCAGGCADAWPVFEGEAEMVLPSAFTASQFGKIDRADGNVQVTYAGRPLYFFAQDTERGETNGKDIPNWGLATVQL